MSQHFPMANRRIQVPLAAVAVLLVCLAQPVSARQAVPLDRLESGIRMDGVLDEDAWARVDPLPVSMYEPVFEGPMTERTEIRVAYDDVYLYVGGRMFDSDPDGIRSNTLYRDRYSGDDTFAIILDTFDDNENALWFYTTPDGVRVDMAVTGDAESAGRGGTNDSWNTYWDVATSRDEQGWYAEMRIPYSSLGFQTVNGKVTMGMIVYRYISRKGERHIYPPVSPEHTMGFAKPSQAATIVLEGVQAQKPIYVTPYVTGGSTRTAGLDGSGIGYDHATDVTRNAGLDVKYNLTDNLTLDLTANTDFAQVEADDQQVNLSRFSLFFPEKRQFFQERAGLFDFTFGRRDRLFHSRQIGLNNGETVRILGGGRVVGRVGSWDLGVLDLQTESIADLPSENFGVVRLRRRVFNDQSYAGSMFTSRLGTDGHSNLAYGLDGLLMVGGQEFLDLKWSQSFDSEQATGLDVLDTGIFMAQLQRRGSIGLSYRLETTWAGPAFDPGVGFVTRTDYTQLGWDFQYGWLMPDASALRTHDGSIFGGVYFRNGDGSVETANVKWSWDFDYKSSAAGRADGGVDYEDLQTDLSFPEGTTVPAGRYTFVDAGYRYTFPDGSLLRGSYGVSGGSFYDGWKAEVTAEPTWNLSRHLELGGSYRFTRIEFPDRNQEADVHLVGIRTQVGLNTKISLNSFIQYNTAADLVVANVRFRYNFREGSDLWLVYNENMNADRARENPRLPFSRNRTILLKYTYTFIL